MADQNQHLHDVRSNRARQRDYRARLRAQGLRPIEVWVPDTRSPEFVEQCRRQLTRIADYKRQHGWDYDFWECDRVTTDQ